MAVPVPARGRILIGIALCSAASVWFSRGGLIPAFFLAPLGVASYCFSPGSAWIASIIALGTNGVIALSSGGDLTAAAAGALYFALTVLCFAWIAAPPEKGPAFLRVSVAMRIVLAASAVSAAFIPLAYLLGRDSAFYAMMKDQAELVVSVYRSMTASDPVASSLQDGSITADFVLTTMIFIALRGGALISTA
jgi:hypothetical protein